MPAPDLYTLYAFEDALEPAVVTALTDLDVPTCRQRNGSLLGTPRVEVALWLGAPTGRQVACQGALYTPGQTYPSAYHGKLALTTVTNRKGGPANAGRHAEFLGKSRFVMLLVQGKINALLPYHKISLVKDAGVHPSVERDADLDVSPLIFDLTIEILLTAWPVS